MQAEPGRREIQPAPIHQPRLHFTRDMIEALMGEQFHGRAEVWRP
jgi:hypothetical protein